MQGGRERTAGLVEPPGARHWFAMGNSGVDYYQEGNPGISEACSKDCRRRAGTGEGEWEKERRGGGPGWRNMAMRAPTTLLAISFFLSLVPTYMQTHTCVHSRRGGQNKRLTISARLFGLVSRLFCRAPSTARQLDSSTGSVDLSSTSALRVEHPVNVG